jgi:hypothetical protein
MVINEKMVTTTAANHEQKKVPVGTLVESASAWVAILI